MQNFETVLQMFPKCFFADFTCFIELLTFVYFISTCTLHFGIGVKLLMNLWPLLQCSPQPRNYSSDFSPSVARVCFPSQLIFMLLFLPRSRLGPRSAFSKLRNCNICKIFSVRGTKCHVLPTSVSSQRVFNFKLFRNFKEKSADPTITIAVRLIGINIFRTNW